MDYKINKTALFPLHTEWPNSAFSHFGKFINNSGLPDIMVTGKPLPKQGK